MAWTRGELIVRRNIVDGTPWFGYPVYVVADEPELLAVYVPEDSPFGFPSGTWPTPTGRHPENGVADAWRGHGCLQLHRPQDRYAVWVLWNDAPPHDWVAWRVTLQTPVRRTELGVETEDHLLHVDIGADGKGLVDGEVELDTAVQLGRLGEDVAAEARRTASEVVAMVEGGGHWWADLWQRWRPDRQWVAPAALPDGWDRVPPPSADG